MITMIELVRYIAYTILICSAVFFGIIIYLEGKYQEERKVALKDETYQKYEQKNVRSLRK